MMTIFIQDFEFFIKRQRNKIPILNLMMTLDNMHLGKIFLWIIKKYYDFNKAVSSSKNNELFL